MRRGEESSEDWWVLLPKWRREWLVWDLAYRATLPYEKPEYSWKKQREAGIHQRIVAVKAFVTQNAYWNNYFYVIDHIWLVTSRMPNRLSELRSKDNIFLRSLFYLFYLKIFRLYTMHKALWRGAVHSASTATVRADMWYNTSGTLASLYIMESTGFMILVGNSFYPCALSHWRNRQSTFDACGLLTAWLITIVNIHVTGQPRSKTCFSPFGLKRQ